MSKIPFEIITTVLAMAGGMAKFLNELMKGRKYIFWEMLAHLFISGFVGYSMASFGMSLGIDENGTRLVAAWGGVVGLKAFELVQSFVEKKL